jgi:hypothetical protein
MSGVRSLFAETRTPERFVGPVIGFRSVSSHRIAWLKILLIASRIFSLVPPARGFGLPNFVVTSVLSHCSTATVLTDRNSTFPQWGTTHRLRSCVFLERVE